MRHGTYFGALFMMGLTQPRQGPPDLKKALIEHQFAVLSSVIFAIAGILECISERFGIPALRQAADDALDRLGQLPSMQEALSKSSDQVTPDSLV